MKRCSDCGEVKEFTEFRKNKCKKDGLSGYCKTCLQQRDQKYRKERKKWEKKYYQKNREKLLKRRREHHQKNREKQLERQAQYYQRNREKLIKQSKEYKNRNVHHQNRRARKKNAAGSATAIEIQARFDYHGNCCYYCGCDGKMTIEHRIPLSRGGSNWPSNIVPACLTCNCKKGKKTEKEFLKGLQELDNGCR